MSFGSIIMLINAKIKLYKIKYFLKICVRNNMLKIKNKT